MSGGEHDPPRLLDEGGSQGELRALMRAGKSEVPNEAQMLALAAKIGVIGGLGGAGAAGASGAGAAAKAGIAVKLIAALALIGVTGGGIAVVVKRSGERVEAPVGIVAVAVTASASASASAATATATATATTTSVSAAPTVSAPRNVESPDAEVKLLGRAQDALRGRPEEALALCAEHAKRFPAGANVQEREVIAIDALVRLGRKDEARARADRFEARFPGSTHQRRIETLLAN